MFRSASRSPETDAARPAAVLDLLRRGAGADGLRRRVRVLVVARVDHDHGLRGGPRRPGRDGEDEHDDEADQRADHRAAPPLPAKAAPSPVATPTAASRSSAEPRSISDAASSSSLPSVSTTLACRAASIACGRDRELAEELLARADQQRRLLVRAECDREGRGEAQRICGQLEVSDLLRDLEAVDEPPVRLLELPRRECDARQREARERDAVAVARKRLSLEHLESRRTRTFEVARVLVAPPRGSRGRSGARSPRPFRRACLGPARSTRSRTRDHRRRWSSSRARRASCPASTVSPCSR